MTPRTLLHATMQEEYRNTCASQVCIMSEKEDKRLESKELIFCYDGDDAKQLLSPTFRLNALVGPWVDKFLFGQELR